MSAPEKIRTRHTMTTLLLIDGSNYLFRAFHALPPLATSRGEPTGAIKGFNGMLKTVFDIVKPDFAACVFDASGKNFRHDIYPQYKANRPPMPDELRVQIAPIFELIKLKGIPLLQIAGVEADDVLATLAVKGEKAGMDVVIATGDKDLAQMVTDHVTLINTMSRTRYDRQGVFEKYGVYPERIIDYLALMGDKVDNVPGINKCGPKTAAKWIAEYGSMDNLLAHAQEIKGKIGEHLREGMGFLDVARRLVTINSAAPGVQLAPTDLVVQGENAAGLEAFFVRWEMRSGARKKVQPLGAASQPGLFDAPAIPNDVQAPASAPAASVQTAGSVARTRQELAELALRLKQSAQNTFPTAVAVLCDRLNAINELPVGMSFAVSALESCYVPLGHADGSNAERSDVLELLGPWFAGESAKVFYNAKFDGHVLENFGLPAHGRVDDASLMSYVLEAHLKHDFSKIAARYLASAAPDQTDVLGKGAARRAASSLSVEEAAGTFCSIAVKLHAAAAVMLEKLAVDHGLLHIYEDIELPVMRVLQKMERTGVLVDAHKLSQQSSQLGTAIEAVKAKIDEIVGEPFNPGSPKQLAHILFEKQGLPVKKKTASGTPSTDEEVLSELALDYPLPKLVLEYRALSKLKSTYTDKLAGLADAQGRVHTTFGQTTAVTGRLASSEPNLQNIPVRTTEGRRVREAFVAPAGCKILSADYSQIELRIMAHISGDEGLLNAFRLGRDIHRATAAEVFGTALEDVTAQQRRMAKVINFGLIYGMSAFGLAQNLGLERSVAAHYISEYFARYPKVAQYMEQTRVKARTQGYVQTAFGRRLWLPDITSSRAPVRAAAERAAINAPMQGTAADLIKMAMVAVDKWLTAQGLKSRMILQVHDELILEVPEEEVPVMKQKVAELMAGAARLSVPLVAEVGVADNWEAAH